MISMNDKIVGYFILSIPGQEIGEALRYITETAHQRESCSLFRFGSSSPQAAMCCHAPGHKNGT